VTGSGDSLHGASPHDEAPLERLNQLLVSRRDEIDPINSDGAPTSVPMTRAARPLDSLDRQRKHLENCGLKDELTLKRHYGYGLIVILIVQLLIMNVVFVAAGMKLLSFSEYVLHLYMGGTLLEIFGLVLIVTKYLFKR
jgi:hypothetical protein